MPWLSIIVAILSFLASLKKNPGDKGKAVAIGALAGLGTYYVSHETDWGRENLGSLDGVVNVPPVPLGSDGKPVPTTTLPDGSKIPVVNTSVPSTSTGGTTGLWEAIKNVGAGGVAAVVGVGAGVAASKTDWSKFVGPIAAGLLIYWMIK